MCSAASMRGMYHSAEQSQWQLFHCETTAAIPHFSAKLVSVKQISCVGTTETVITWWKYSELMTRSRINNGRRRCGSCLRGCH